MILFLAELAQTKPTNAENTPRITLDGLGFSHGARMAEKWYYIAVMDKQGHAEKSHRKQKNALPFSDDRGRSGWARRS